MLSTILSVPSWSWLLLMQLSNFIKFQFFQVLWVKCVAVNKVWARKTTKVALFWWEFFLTLFYFQAIFLRQTLWHLTQLNRFWRRVLPFFLTLNEVSACEFCVEQKLEWILIILFTCGLFWALFVHEWVVGYITSNLVNRSKWHFAIFNFLFGIRLFTANIYCFPIKALTICQDQSYEDKLWKPGKPSRVSETRLISQVQIWSSALQPLITLLQIWISVQCDWNTSPAQRKSSAPNVAPVQIWTSQLKNSWSSGNRSRTGFEHSIFPKPRQNSIPDQDLN